MNDHYPIYWHHQRISEVQALEKFVLVRMFLALFAFCPTDIFPLVTGDSDNTS